ncbi:MAG: hypothetical protein UY05_C0007G0004 [Candidatus Peregrinibacteria bacterium GW2011_GWA2_47_7]|nr:MAG: hypothetical protein UY05_C0007G0004 [Candidatus Peregrinibacteria bacterium GW2011_GWA2_47_7]
MDKKEYILWGFLYFGFLILVFSISNIARTLQKVLEELRTGFNMVEDEISELQPADDGSDDYSIEYNNNNENIDSKKL